MNVPMTPAAQRAAQAAAAKPQRVKRMTLASITKGKLDKPLRVMLYGTEGVGKSSFAADAPNAIFICAEDGTGHLDVARFPEVQDWNDVLDAIDVLTNDAHEHKTLVIDTLDWVEPFIWKHLCETRPTESGGRAGDITDYGYGKGYAHALESWRVLVNKLERLQRVKGMDVITLAHSQVKSFKNPVGEDFDHYTMKLHQSAAGLLFEWHEAVLFARQEIFAVADKKKRVRGVSDGARVMHTERTAAWAAKNRYSLPATIPLDYSAFAEAVKEGKTASAETLKAKIRAVLESVTDETLIEKANGYIDSAGDDAVRLASVLDRLVAKIGITNQENE